MLGRITWVIALVCLPTVFVVAHYYTMQYYNRKYCKHKTVHESRSGKIICITCLESLTPDEAKDSIRD